MRICMYDGKLGEREEKIHKLAFFRSHMHRQSGEESPRFYIETHHDLKGPGLSRDSKGPART